MPPSPAARMLTAIKPHRTLLAILAVSALLRIGLAFQGGQFFFGDEPRYLRGTFFYQAVRTGDTATAIQVFTRPQHVGFTWISVLLVPVQHGLAQFTPWADWSRQENIVGSMAIGAALLGLCATLNLWLVYRLALAAGAERREALWATLLAAAAHSLFYYSRHLLPYDCALAAGLAAVLCSLRGGEGRAFASGACAGLAFHIYYGYWFIVPVAGLALLLARDDWPARGRAALFWSLGGTAVTLPMVLPGLLWGGGNYWSVLTGFSGTVTQGLFAEGWSLPWAYLYHTEGVLGLAVVAAIGAALALDWRTGRPPRRALLWLLLAGTVYALLVLASVGLEKFVVYARMVRVMVPLFCLAGGYAIERLLTAHARWRAAVAALVIAAGGSQMLPDFLLLFPVGVETSVRQLHGNPKQAVSFSGVYYHPPSVPVTRPDLALVDARLLIPLRDYIGPPAGTVIFSVSHPLNFLPYQYDGFAPRERRLLRQHRPSIQLIRLTQPDTVPDQPSVALICRPEEEPDGYDRGRR